jgi:hypothetical protein
MHTNVRWAQKLTHRHSQSVTSRQKGAQIASRIFLRRIQRTDETLLGCSFFFAQFQVLVGKENSKNYTHFI